MEWIGDSVSERGVCEQRFDVECEGRRVPGILWRPAETTELGPVALLGHGGSLHKRTDYILATARRLVRHHGISAIAIDGPGHGDRRADGGLDPEQAGTEFESEWKKPETTENTVADWKAALDAVQSELGSGPVGYFGLSMGTMMGVPVIAAEPRVRAAVLGDGSNRIGTFRLGRASLCELLVSRHVVTELESEITSPSTVARRAAEATRRTSNVQRLCRPARPTGPSCLAMSMRGGRLNATHVRQEGVFTEPELDLFGASLRADLAG